MKHLLLQIETTGAADEVLEETAKKGFDYLDLIVNGGWVLIPILILSIIGVYIMIERYLSIRKAVKTDSTFMSNIKSMVGNDDINGARRLCVENKSPVARMIEKGLSRMGKPLKDIRVAVENVGNLEIYKLERGMPVLATIAGAAPMLGFLGTVTGMIRTFFQLQESGQQITADLLSGGIGEAMITTVAGLIVGIIAYVAYNLLSAMINKVVYKMEASSLEFLDILHEPIS